MSCLNVRMWLRSKGRAVISPKTASDYRPRRLEEEERAHGGPVGAARSGDLQGWDFKLHDVAGPRGIRCRFADSGTRVDHRELCGLLEAGGVGKNLSLRTRTESFVISSRSSKSLGPNHFGRPTSRSGPPAAKPTLAERMEPIDLS